tara:strand:+ start:18548 stop:19420 length:873 start_codon:yes stop_codon:yes gene_type:complete
MKTERLKRDYWTEEKILEEAKKYIKFTDFLEKSNLAYKMAKEKGLIKEVKKITKTFSYSTSFKEEKTRAIISSATGKDFDKINFKHKGKRIELDGYNNSLKLAFEYNGRQHYELLERFHNTWDGFIKQLERDDRKKECCKNKGIRLITIPFWIKESDLKDYILKELDILSIKYSEKNIDKCIKEKYFGLKWDVKSIKKEAKKYRTRNSFRLGAVGAYNAAKRFGIFDEVCSHMLSKKERMLEILNKWDYESCKKEAAKYKSRWEYQKGSGGSYRRAWKEGWLEEFFPKKP